LSEQVKRHEVDFRFDALNWNFLKIMAQLAHFASIKYGKPEQYIGARLIEGRSPMNHIAEHMRQYMAGEAHDHFGDPAFHLAAIAYNAMMEFFYLRTFGPLVAYFGKATTAPGTCVGCGKPRTECLHSGVLGVHCKDSRNVNSQKTRLCVPSDAGPFPINGQNTRTMELCAREFCYNTWPSHAQIPVCCDNHPTKPTL
jgi:hypothetical protein